MSHHVGNTEQPSEPPPSTRAEQVFCTLAFTVLAVAVILCLFEQGHEVQLPRGLYAILASGIVIGGVGWTVVWSVSRAEARVAAGIEADQREVLDRLAELTIQVESLTAALAQSRVAHMPGTQRRAVGHRYFGAAAVGATGDALSMRTGLDPETIAAARSVARRLVDADTLARLDSQDS